jgi:hypothetical protein
MRRVVTWLAIGAVALLVVLTALILSLPLLLDSELVKGTAVRQLSRATGGQWRLAHLQFRWRPVPTISATGASFSLPGTLEGRVETVTLTIALVPLLWGEIRLGHVALAAPDVTVAVVPSPTGAASAFTVSDLRASLAGLASGAVDLGSLSITIARGRLALVASDQSRLTLRDIQGQATGRSGRLEVEVTSASDVWRRLDARISFAPERFDGHLQLEATDIDLVAVDPHLRGLVSGRARIQIVGSPALRGTFEASSSTISVTSRGGRLDVQDLAAEGEAEWTDAGLRVVARDAHASTPALQGSAVLNVSPDWSRQRVDVKMQPMGLDTVKQVALPWVADIPEVERYAGMVTSGQLHGLEATLQLDQLGQWPQAIEVRGAVAGAALTLTRPEVSIRDLDAVLMLTGGKLTAERVRATTGHSTLANGRLELDFTAVPTGISATAQWGIDLAEALAFARRQLGARERERLNVLRALTGNARGAVSLIGPFAQPRVLAETDTVRAEASLAPLPWPIKVAGAKARFDGGGLVVQGLAGTVGSSSFAQCSGQITLASPSGLEVSRCDADLGLAELFDWAWRQWRKPDALQDLRVIGGRGLVQIHRIAGRLEEPSAWSADITLTPKAVRLTHSRAPGELRLEGGSVRSDLASATVQDVTAEVLDAALRVSGAVAGLREGAPRLDARATGRVGQQALAWGRERLGVPRGAAQIAPFEARAARLRWPVNKGFETTGQLLFGGKTTVSFDASIQPELVEVRRLAIQDEHSNARMSIHRHQAVLDGSFAGSLAGASLERIAGVTQVSEARLAGDLTFRIPLAEPRDFRANGRLRVSRLASPGWAAAPVAITVHDADIKAADRSLNLIGSFSARDTGFDVSGTIRAADRRYALDVDVKSDRVDVERLLAELDQSGGPPSGAPSTSWDFPIEGQVRLAIGSLHYGPYDVKPLRADLDIVPGHVDFAVREASLCGIGAAGRGRAQPDTVAIDVELRARDVDAQPTLLCLSRERAAITGRLHADARLTGAGPYRSLARHLQGPFHIVAHHGRVDRLGGLADILDLINTSELLRGRKLDLRSSGFAYDEFVIKGRLEGETIQFDEMVLDAQPFDLVASGSVDWWSDAVDMNVAVAPLQLVNTIVRAVPVLGYVLGGGVYAVPVGVRGKLSNPQIVPVAPTAVADGLRGVMERTLKVPFNLREVLLPPPRSGPER